MSRYIGSINRVARKLGHPIFDKKIRQENEIVRPGQHGLRRRKVSEYGRQLLNKQTVKALYGMLLNRQFVRYCKEATANSAKSRLSGRTFSSAPQELVKKLESRLDIFCYRAKFSASQFSARQLVSHGHVEVNGKKVDIPSFQLRVGDKVTICKKSIEKAKAKGSANQLLVEKENREIPSFIERTGYEAIYKFYPETTEHVPLLPPLGEVISFVHARG